MRVRVQENRHSRSDVEFIPDDAGDYRDQLLDIIQRMSSGYWPHIGVSVGWYPLIVNANEQLDALCHNYKITSLTKSNGTIQYFFRLPSYDDDELVKKCIAIVVKAQELARKTCEVCGEMGSPDKSERFVFCETHTKKVVRRKRTSNDEVQRDN